MNIRTGLRKTVEEPPRDAVHGRHHSGLRTEQRRNAGGNSRHGRSLHSDNYNILRTEVSRCVAGRGMYVKHLATGFDSAAIGP